LAAGGPAREGIPRRENDLPQPVSDYGSSKLAAEVALRQLADRVPITVLRPPGVFGPRERYILGLFRAAKRGWVALPQGGNQRVALLHVRDLVACMEQAALHGRRLDVKTSPARESRGVYQVAAREQPTIVEMANRIAAILGHPRPVRVVYVPRRVVWSAATAAQVAWEVRRRRGFFNRDKMREAFAGDWTCDPRRAERELGFRASAPLDDQLRETADWYREHGWL
jgi:nucleoside-diphosphate-sugar epimerase